MLLAGLGPLLLACARGAQAQTPPAPRPSSGVPTQQPNVTQPEPEPEDPEQEEAILTPNPPIESDVPLLGRFAPGLTGGMAQLPPFFRDTSLKLRLRTYYFNRRHSDGTQNEAWVQGGWIDYKSGWLADRFAVGAVGYTSLPLYAPDDKAGTGLLRPPQQSILVLGQAYAQLRYQEYALLTGYRQEVDEGYVSRGDIRMVPQTFEGVTLRGKLGPVDYNGGYITAIKPRTEEGFLNMAAAAGVTTGQNRGLVLTRISADPADGLSLYGANYLVPDVFNTAHGRAEYAHRLTTDLSFQIGAQYTDQRSAGSELLGDFSTWNTSTRGLIEWRGLTVGAALSANGAGSHTRIPYGDPRYLSFMERFFNRANEKAWGLAVQYDFDAETLLPGVRIPGLTMFLRYGHGTDGVDSSTHRGLPTVGETDVYVLWNVPWIKGLQFRIRNAYVTEGGERGVVKSFRANVNYQIPLLLGRR